MKRRLAAILPPHQARAHFFTFHGLAWAILKSLRGAPKMLETAQQHTLIRQILKELNLNADQTAVDNILTDIACFVGGQIPAPASAPTPSTTTTC